MMKFGVCRYCFYLEKGMLHPDTKRHRMSDEVLECVQVSYSLRGKAFTIYRATVSDRLPFRRSLCAYMFTSARAIMLPISDPSSG